MSVLQVLVPFLGGLPLPAEAGAWGLAIALVAAVVLAVVTAVAAPAPGVRSGPHPRRAIDLSSALAQSDPDAAGHPRPRAPQTAASAA